MNAVRAPGGRQALDQRSSQPTYESADRLAASLGTAFMDLLGS